MRPPLSLETLEGRMLLSAAYSELAGVVLSAPLSNEVAGVRALPKTDGGDGLNLAAQDLTAPSIQSEIDWGRDVSILYDHDDSPPVDAFDWDWVRQGARDALSSVVGSLENSSEVRVENGLPVIQSVPARETTDGSVQDRSRAVLEPSGQAPTLPAGAAVNNNSSLGPDAPSEQTVDLAAAGSFADIVFLDAWQDGLPAPQPELAPAVDKNLTIIPAYLVGAPPAMPAKETTPNTETETGPTDFIVGFQDRQPTPSPPRAAETGQGDKGIKGEEEMSMPLCPLIPLHSRPARVPESAKVDMCNVPPDGKQGSPDGKPDMEADSEPEETADGEEAA
jgi:hypothetical protein